MPAPSLAPRDLDDLRDRGIPEAEARRILARLQQPPRFVTLLRAGTRLDGVRALGQLEELTSRFDALELVPGKFTPMSGAASRMFGFLEKVLADQATPDDANKLGRFVQALDRRHDGPRFAFDSDLAAVLRARGQDLQQLIVAGEPRAVVAALLDDDGLGFRSKPKALIPFHRRQGRAVLALEEHLREAQGYAGNRLHITISPEHRPLFELALVQIRTRCPELASVQVDMSVQHPSTDALALDVSTLALVRDADDRLAFFPAGHGALLRNLQELGRPAVLRNVDNVPASARAREMVNRHHRALAVVLAELKAELGRLIQELDAGHLSRDELRAGLDGLRERGVGVLLDPARFDAAPDPDQRRMARYALDRPVKIAGMVRNEGEPGGGPFVVEHGGLTFLSIVEKDEIARDQKQLMRDGEFFNPVDLLVDPTDHRGQPMDLQRFVNQDRCFIVRKPYRGRDILRLEQPGLWNGAMDGWTSLFVELPLETFAPVKEVNDLLRAQHQEA
ncbi:MAG: DUF4301 family protein [Pseudomonadota bacterium]